MSTPHHSYTHTVGSIGQGTAETEVQLSGIWYTARQLCVAGCSYTFILPCLGWSPLPRNRPGGSVLKLPIFCLHTHTHTHTPNSFLFLLYTNTTKVMFIPLLVVLWTSALSTASTAPADLHYTIRHTSSPAATCTSCHPFTKTPKGHPL